MLSGMASQATIADDADPSKGSKEDVVAGITLVISHEDDVLGIDDCDDISEGGSSKYSTKTRSEDGDARSTMESGEAIFGDGRKTQMAISFSRCLFFFVLIAAAAVLATIVYLVLTDGETDDFESQFQSLAGEFTHLSNNKVGMVFGTLQGLSVSATSLAVHQHLEDPAYPLGFVTIPDAQSQLGAARNVTGALVIAYMPNVESIDYDLWIQYSEEHSAWLSEAHSVTEDESSSLPNVSSYIWEYEDPSDKPQGRRSLESCSARRRLSRQLGKEDQKKVAVDPQEGPFSPVWTMDPAPALNNTEIINYNLRDRPVFQRSIEMVSYTRNPVFLDVCDQSAWFGIATNKDILQTVVAFPVFGSFDSQSKVVGMFTAIVPWAKFFQDNLVQGNIVMVMSPTCDETFTFEINGTNATFIGEGDLHDRRYDDMAFEVPFADLYNPKDSLSSGGAEHCVYTMIMYPTQSLEAESTTMEPLYYSLMVVAIFCFTALAFLFFDCLVTRRQDRIFKTAKKQNAIVSSLFPTNIRKKLMEEADTEGRSGKKNNKISPSAFLQSNEATGDPSAIGILGDKPIADLFPETTIMFADIAGFTAWSSTREPHHVFILLETIYSCFDALAKRRRVFKVEVVGDCYVAVSGLPDPCQDHYVRMCKFAEDCLTTMQSKTKELEVALGPGTAELGLRVGLHSGPVVAGVLRGDKTRFQLFGDTMNVASRMESTGVVNRIQVSQQTADLLISVGKRLWLTPREDPVEVKGKGELRTYFISVKRDTASVHTEALTDPNCTGSTDEQRLELNPIEKIQKRNRVADWMVEILSSILREVLTNRQASHIKADNVRIIEALEVSQHRNLGITDHMSEASVALKGETAVAQTGVKKDLSFPSRAVKSFELDSQVIAELRDYVQVIASLYNSNSFHCFDHASHVTMSCTKLLSRIVAPAMHDVTEEHPDDFTYGITSDPLDRFAVVFAALIHDVDHSGVPNSQLVKEGHQVAEMYSGESVAEQNSFNIAWKLLLQPKFTNLRRGIYATTSEFKRFRYLVANYVLATDIMDPNLKQLRNNRWAAAFATSDDEASPPDLSATKSSKAMIVMEHLIQASDVAHTMQHWTIYRKWNERYFEECYRAFQQGRADKNPADTWYEGEKGFFDFYIIPLAKKLKDCGVFGVSSAEYLSYAMENRKEWEKRGQQVVAEMVGKMTKT